MCFSRNACTYLFTNISVQKTNYEIIGKLRASVLCITVDIQRNLSAPEFIGPIYTDVDYYFICRVVYTDSLQVNFDVTLTFDGQQLPGGVVRSVSSTSSLDVIFTPQDFTGHFGKTVWHRRVCILKYRSVSK